MLTLHVSKLDRDMKVRTQDTAFRLKASSTWRRQYGFGCSSTKSFCKWLLLRGFRRDALTRTLLCSADKSPFLCLWGFRSKIAAHWPRIPTVPHLSGLVTATDITQADSREYIFISCKIAGKQRLVSSDESALPRVLNTLKSDWFLDYVDAISNTDVTDYTVKLYGKMVMNDELVNVWKGVVACLNTGICLERMRKTTTNLGHNLSNVRRTNLPNISPELNRCIKTLVYRPIYSHTTVK
jgi:hypothetical protein